MPPIRAQTTAAEERKIDALVDAFTADRDRVSLFLDQIRLALSESSELDPYLHSLKWRLKDADHLRDKLRRKLVKAKQDGKQFGITRDNLLERVNDLAGIRLLHLHTRQIQDIDRVLRAILVEHRYNLLEGPFARTWDDESKAFFASCGIEPHGSPTLYTSVHYVVGSASRTRVTCEIQVRTLMEEVWGEVDHTINYPHQTDSLACSEQIKVLARVTSSATRLVDAIFATVTDEADRTRNVAATRRVSSKRKARAGKKSASRK